MTFKEFHDKYKEAFPGWLDEEDFISDTKMIILSNLTDIKFFFDAGMGDNKLVGLKIESLKEFVSDAFSVIKLKSEYGTV